MNPEQRVREFLALFDITKLDVRALRSMLADDARYHPLVPIAPVCDGADKNCEEMERQYELFSECTCDILQLAVNGKTVFTERVDTARQRAGGQKTTTRAVGVFELADDGRIASWRECWDGLDCAGQPGVDDKAMRAMMGA